ncbi:MAG: DNA/RNA nuclease SfsA [Candidatus Neomarinimicrobiota bacterium]
MSTAGPIIMPVPWRLIPATLVDRPNRFLTRIRLNDTMVSAHLPDPGRLEELLLPGVDLLVQHSPGPGRKTDYTVHLVQRPSLPGWVCINTLLPNRFVEFLLQDSHLPFLDGWSLAGAEVTVGHSRFDFLLEQGRKRLYLEVKSVTYVEGGVAQFPDAVSARAAKHARHLADLVANGAQAMILFVIQRDDAHTFRPMWDRDPETGRALNEAHRAGVAVRAIKLTVTPEVFTLAGQVSVDLEP